MTEPVGSNYPHTIGPVRLSDRQQEQWEDFLDRHGHDNDTQALRHMIERSHQQHGMKELVEQIREAVRSEQEEDLVFDIEDYLARLKGGNQ